MGGAAVYNFLHLPSSPLLSASGGINLTYLSEDVGLAANNPALLREAMHSQLNASFNAYFASVKAYHLAGAYHLQKPGITLGGAIFYVDYGNTVQTTPAGEEEGNFHPKDFSIQLSAGKKYLKNWQYGLTAKFIHSAYGQYSSSGIAFDAGVLFFDSSHSVSVSMLAKNMGVQLTAFNDEKEDLPFDLQLGITKRLEKAPLAFSLTAQQIHRFDINYKDTLFENENGFSSGTSFTGKFFNHFVVATHIYFGDQLETTIGYNRLRRSELNLGNTGNGLNGFSAGFKVKFRKLQFQYARAYFAPGAAYNQFGLNTHLEKLFSLNDL